MVVSSLGCKTCDFHVSFNEAPRALEISRPEIWQSLEVESRSDQEFRASLSVPTSWGTVRARGPWVRTRIEAEQHIALEVYCLLGQKHDLLDEEYKNETDGKRINELEEPSCASETCMEYRVRSMPRCLCLGAGPLNVCFRLHALDISGCTGFSTTDTCASLAILLPVSLHVPFMVYPPGGQVSGYLKWVQEDPLQLSDDELKEVAAWSFQVLTLFQIPIAHVSQLLRLELQPLVLNHATGELSIDSVQAGPPKARFPLDEPYCMVAPLNVMKTGIDWEFLHRSLLDLSTGEFPELKEGLDTDRLQWFDVCTKTTTAINSMVVSGYGHGPKKLKRQRRQFFTDLSLAESVGPADDGMMVSETRLAGTVVHRSFALAGADQAARPDQADSGYTVGVSSCRVMPLTGQLVREVLLLPAILWQTELLLGIDEFESGFVALHPPVHIDSELLRIAMTRLGVAVGLQKSNDEPNVFAAGDNGERLEFLGDALLKYVSRLAVFVEQPKATEGTLTQAADRFVKNAFLREVAERLGICDHIMARNFNRRVSDFAVLRRQVVPWKAGADAMEAFLAAVWLTAHSGDSPKLDKSCDALIEFFRHHLKRDPRIDDHSYAELLENHQMFGITSDKKAHSEPACTQIPGDISLKQYIQRLEFLGDAVLQAIVSEHLFFILPDVSEGCMHFAREWLLGNSYLGRCAADRLSNDTDGKLKLILSELSGGGKSSVDSFLAERKKACERTADFLEVADGADGPKCLGDLYEVIVAGCLISSRGCLHTVWKEIMRDFDIPADIIRARVMEHMRALGCEQDCSQDCLADKFAVHPTIEQSITSRCQDSKTSVENNPKGALNEFMSRAMSRPVNRGDVVYEIVSPLYSQIQVRVWLPAIHESGPRSFTGEACKTKKDAEQSAARVALSSLMGIDAKTEAIVTSCSVGSPDVDIAKTQTMGAVGVMEMRDSVDGLLSSESTMSTTTRVVKTSKSELNELVMGKVGHPLKKDDIAYQHSGQDGLFRATVCLIVLQTVPEHGASLEFSGELCRKKKDAEESAAKVAINTLGEFLR